ncbi:type II toxin-antitoxin system YafQ family toxin [Thiotrichales bacterium 19X7-9]|nr:type II toxin-antitoxin system YafQ family toxin [Thiotrichales bacterium 19X7-9]
MLELELSSQFRKDLKKIAKQNKDRNKLNQVIETLQMEKPLADKYRDHLLTGNWKGHRECHITPDWLLIYKVVEGNVRLLRLSRTGSHSELFKK